MEVAVLTHALDRARHSIPGCLAVALIDARSAGPVATSLRTGAEGLAQHFNVVPTDADAALRPLLDGLAAPADSNASSVRTLVVYTDAVHVRVTLRMRPELSLVTICEPTTVLGAILGHTRTAARHLDEEVLS